MTKLKMHMPALLASVALITPFMPWKTVKITGADGKEVEAVDMKDGNPVWLDSNGTESTMGGDTISRLNHEAMTNRKDLKAATDALKAFEGITDPAAAKKALETVGKLDAKALIDAGEVDKVKNQITEQFQGQIKERDETNAKLRTENQQMKIDNAFATSKFMSDKVALPPDIAKTYFAKNITFDDNGQMIINDASGNQIRSKAKIGEVAGFDEALELIVADYPNRDAILKGGNHQGSGNNGGGGAGKPGMKTYRRSEFDALATSNPAAAQAAAKEIQAGTAQVLD